MVGDRPRREIVARRRSSDPDGQLGGPAVRGRYGDVLPLLVKVLAAEEPLSLQAHPSAEQAVEGYVREDRLGVPLTSPIRNYRDRNHKPELLVALSDFHALGGFRPAARSVDLMRALAAPELDPFIGLLSGQPDADGLRALFTTWITAPQPDLDVLIPPAVLDARWIICVPVQQNSTMRPRRCWSWGSAIPEMRVCWRPCCSTGSRWPPVRPSSCRQATCTVTSTAWGGWR